MLEFLMSEDALLRMHAGKGNVDKVRECLQHGAQITKKDNHGNPPITPAVKHNQVQVVQVLLNAREPVDDRGEFGMTPLILASKHGFTNMCDLLLTKGADVNAQDDFGVTALSRAVLGRHGDIVIMLLETGARMDIRDHLGKDSIFYACHSNTVEIADLMLEYCVKNGASQEVIVRLENAECRKYKQLSVLLEKGVIVGGPAPYQMVM